MDGLLPPSNAAPDSPSAMAQALGGYLFPYLQQPTGPASFQPNAAGKIPEVDPLAGPAGIAKGAIDMAGMLGPELAAKGAAPAALHLMPRNRYFGRGIESEYKVLDDAGNHVINLSTTYHPHGKSLYVDWVGRPSPEETGHPAPWGAEALNPYSQIEYYKNSANTLGPKEIRSLVKALMKDYPDMETIEGERISGARGPNNLDTAIMRVKKK